MSGIIAGEVWSLSGKWRADNFMEEIAMRKVRFTELNDVLEKINKRRASSLVRKKIWIVVGNGFSLSHFKSQFNPSVVKKSQESMQSYQLIDSWLLQSKSLGIDLKFFVSP